MTNTSVRSRSEAKRLLRWSNLVAWPGVAILFLGVPSARNAGASTTVVLAIGMVSLAMIIGGAIIGQFGKKRLRDG